MVYFFREHMKPRSPRILTEQLDYFLSTDPVREGLEVDQVHYRGLCRRKGQGRSISKESPKLSLPCWNDLALGTPLGASSMASHDGGARSVGVPPHRDSQQGPC